MTAADICRERGWGVGTLLISPCNEHVIEITATGRDVILFVWRQFHGKQLPLVTREFPDTKDTIADWTAIDRLPWEVPNDAA